MNCFLWLNKSNWKKEKNALSLSTFLFNSKQIKRIKSKKKLSAYWSCLPSLNTISNAKTKTISNICNSNWKGSFQTRVYESREGWMGLKVYPPLLTTILLSLRFYKVKFFKEFFFWGRKMAFLTKKIGTCRDFHKFEDNFYFLTSPYVFFNLYPPRWFSNLSCRFLNDKMTSQQENIYQFDLTVKLYILRQKQDWTLFDQFSNNF